MATDVGAKSTAEGCGYVTAGRHRRESRRPRPPRTGSCRARPGVAEAGSPVSMWMWRSAPWADPGAPQRPAARQGGGVSDRAVRTVPPADFEDVAKALLAVLDPDGSGSFDPNAHERRSLSMAQDATGMTAGRFLLDRSAPPGSAPPCSTTPRRTPPAAGWMSTASRCWASRTPAPPRNASPTRSS